MNKYEDVIFMDGDQADTVLNLINESGWERGFDYLMQYECGEPYESVQHVDGYPPLMFHDNRYVERDGYMMGYNFPFTTVALWRVTAHADYPHEADALYDCAACDMPA